VSCFGSKIGINEKGEAIVPLFLFEIFCLNAIDALLFQIPAFVFHSIIVASQSLHRYRLQQQYELWNENKEGGCFRRYTFLPTMCFCKGLVLIINACKPEGFQHVGRLHKRPEGSKRL
jgi:hypothetical protein